MSTDHREQARLLLGKLATTPPRRCWELPFPLGVFGTLRKGFRNHSLMQLGRIAAVELGFLPHFCARQIDLAFRPGASAPFEVYFYEPDQWQEVIGPVDQLEWFSPGSSQPGSYHRTLAWLLLLESDSVHPAYGPDMLDAERDLQIDPGRWAEHERMPCWIYSSVAENRRAAGRPDSPIIWDGVTKSAPGAQS